MPDFRAEERTFQLVTQLAGRSGRDAPGLVLVQTFQPDAMPFQFAQRHDVIGFLTEELERRTALGYPPVSHLVSIVASGPDATGVAQVLREVRAGLDGRRGDGSRPRAAAAPARVATGRSSWRRPESRGRSRAAPPRCSLLRAPSCVGVVSRRSSTSIRSRCRSAGAGTRVAARLARMTGHDTTTITTTITITTTVTTIEAELTAEPREAEERARRQIALAQIRQYGDPILRMRANEVESFDEELVKLAERMLLLMHDADGVGLAATQVGILRRVFVFNNEGEDVVVVNPRAHEDGRRRRDGHRRLPLARPVADAGRAVRGRDARGSRCRRGTPSASSSRVCRPASSSTSPTTSTAR